MTENGDTQIIADQEKSNNRFFARLAAFYNIDKFLLFRLRTKAAAFLNLPPSQKILDVATGTGSQAYELAKMGHDITGVDISPEMLEQAKKKCSARLNLNFLRMSATRLPFENSSFDASCISLGLHHMSYDVEKLVLQEMRRVTKNRGKIIVIEFMEPKKHFVAKISTPIIRLFEVPHYGSFIDNGLDPILESVGLKVHESTSLLGLFQLNIIINV